MLRISLIALLLVVAMLQLVAPFTTVQRCPTTRTLRRVSLTRFHTKPRQDNWWRRQRPWQYRRDNRTELLATTALGNPTIRSFNFRSSTAASTATDTEETSTAALPRRKSIRKTLQLAAAVTALLVCWRQWPKMLSFMRLVARHYRQILWLVLTSAVAWNTWQWILVKKRQAVDATSEWARYARHPSARGRALLTLCASLALQWVVTRILLWGTWKQAMRVQSGRYLTTGLLQLGPLYIKLGQIISCRPNLLPSEWIVALERLQDDVPAQSGGKAWNLATTAWDSGLTHNQSFSTVFTDFDDQALRAASLGQVHKAKLRESGDVVAIKLQRPFLREMYDQDFQLLTNFAGFMDRLGTWKWPQQQESVSSVGGIQQNWTEIFTDAEAILYREIDYRDEAENGVRFCHDFGLTKQGQANHTTARSLDGKELPSAAPWLRTPYVYQDLSSEKVLVMEFVPSIKITHLDELQAAGVTDQDKEYLADCLARSYLRQFCCNYFFSTDPHPGNLGVEVLNLNSTEPAERVRLVFYDFGQAASLQPIQGEGILEIIQAIVDSDVDRSIESFQKMGVLKSNANLTLVRAKVADNFRTGKVKANRKRLSKKGYKFKKSSSSTNTTTTTTTTSTKSSDAEVMTFFTLPAEYAFVGRALTQMDGVGKTLDPDFDFISSAAPWIYEIKGATKYLQEEVIKWVDKVKSRVCKLFGHDDNNNKALMAETTTAIEHDTKALPETSTVKQE